MLWAAVLVWHCLIQSSLLKCPVRTWKETTATCSKWAAQIHCQCCHRVNNSMSLGLELITFPFPPCTGKRLSVLLDYSLSIDTAPLQAGFSLLFSASCAKGHSPALPPWGTDNQTSTAVLQRKGVGLIGTGILLIIPCIPGEAFIWRFQRIYLFPASHIRHQPYNTAGRLGSCTCSACWVPGEANTSTTYSRGTSFEGTGIPVLWRAKIFPLGLAVLGN